MKWQCGAVAGLPGFSEKSCNDAGEVECSIVWLDYVDACVATALRCLNAWETRGGLGQNVYPERQGNMLDLAMNSGLQPP